MSEEEQKRESRKMTLLFCLLFSYNFQIPVK